MNFGLMDKSYVPSEVEKRCYDFWEDEKLFDINNTESVKRYSIVMPPPNVTGVLHMGHALNNTLQDILCRYKRLKGYSVLWIPGTDHAGIATQNIVEKKIELEDTNRHELGRSKFIESIWKWKNIYGGAITKQMRRLGTSCNWDYERFTMDEGFSFSVRKVFVDMYDDGLIYKGNYIINWCTRCHTALSDLEVEYEECDGFIYKIKYPYCGDSGSLIVATTRPETMLGDVAVAVHPDDNRYDKLSANNVLLPIVDREIPIIRDKYVDKSFGTGVLKITPAHDPNDFEIGNRHNLIAIKVIDDNGFMNSNSGEFEGLNTHECRKKIINILKEQKLLIGVDSHKHSIGHCYRCKTTIEPNLSKQWFIKMKPLAKEAIRAVEDGRTCIIPSSWTKTYNDWLYNIKDWCISRQIWWGHQIPAWTCKECSKVIVAIKTPNLCSGCGCTNLEQDSDVLDTWFSSSLWPFSTMGWPENTDLLRDYYPTSVLVTGFDIIFFWVARMMMMGLYFMKDVPFRDVYVHALIRDQEGKKMSKSKGNVVDPINIIDRYGTDAFRFTLASFAAQGRDIKMCEKRVDGYCNFVNKLWNASRFSLTHIEKGYSKIDDRDLSIVDFWILIRLKKVVTVVSNNLDKYKFNEAADSLYNFIWHEFCDWYIEAIKPALYGKLSKSRKSSTCSVLWFVLHDILIMAHPFLPFVTEEIWHKLPGVKDSIMRATYPNPSIYMADLIIKYKAETDMNIIIDLVSSIRNIRGEIGIPSSVKLDVIFHPENDVTSSLIKENIDLILSLAGLNSLTVDNLKQKPEFAVTTFVGLSTLFILLKDIIDFSKEKLRLEKEIKKVSKELKLLSRKLRNNDFLTKAPENIVIGVKEKYELFIKKLNRIKITLDKIKDISES